MRTINGVPEYSGAIVSFPFPPFPHNNGAIVNRTFWEQPFERKASSACGRVLLRTWLGSVRTQCCFLFFSNSTKFCTIETFATMYSDVYLLMSPDFRTRRYRIPNTVAWLFVRNTYIYTGRSSTYRFYLWILVGVKVEVDRLITRRWKSEHLLMLPPKRRFPPFRRRWTFCLEDWLGESHILQIDVLFNICVT